MIILVFCLRLLSKNFINKSCQIDCMTHEVNEFQDENSNTNIQITLMSLVIFSFIFKKFKS